MGSSSLLRKLHIAAELHQQLDALPQKKDEHPAGDCQHKLAPPPALGPGKV
jgi:hypothetical protein